MQLVAYLRSTLTTALTATVLVVAISMLSANAAQAAAPRDEKGVVLTPLVNGEILPSDSAVQTVVCPTCTCKLLTNQPHGSHHVPENVNVTANVKCTHDQPRVRVTVDLLKDTGWAWEMVAPRGDKTVFNHHYVSTNSASRCSAGTYMGHGSGYYDDAHGNKYGGSMDSASRDITC